MFYVGEIFIAKIARSIYFGFCEFNCCRYYRKSCISKSFLMEDGNDLNKLKYNSYILFNFDIHQMQIKYHICIVCMGRYFSRNSKRCNVTNKERINELMGKDR